MVLSDFVNTFDDEDVICIGANSSYFFIGTKNDFFKDLDLLNNDFIRKARRILNANLRIRKRIQKNGLICVRPSGLGDEYDWQRMVNETYFAITKSDRCIKSTLAYLKNFKRIEEREVKDCYIKLNNHDVAIVIEGSEIGLFWFRHEYDSWRKDNGYMYKKAT